MLTAVSGFAQDSLRMPDSTKFAMPEHKIIVKYDPVPLVMKVFAFQAERFNGKNTSFALTFWYGPDRPYFDEPWYSFARAISAGYNDYGHYTGYSITPEFKMYSGLKRTPPAGFYMSVYSRFLNINSDQLVSLDGVEDFQEKQQLQSISMGCAIGRQYIIRKKFVIDWLIFGVHYGRIVNSYLQLDGAFSRMTPDEVIQNYFTDSEPFIGRFKNAEYKNGVVTVTRYGNWWGIRSGVSLGWMF